MKKSFVIIFLALFIMPLILQTILVACEEMPNAMPLGISPEEFEKQQQKIASLRNVSEWQLMGTRFKESLLKNSIVSSMDAFFTKASWVFRLLFGMPYSLSVTLLIVIGVWIIFFLDISQIISSYSTFSNGASFGIGLGVTIIVAQLKLFELLINAIGTLIFSRDTWWIRLILITVVLIVIATGHIFSGILAAKLQKSKEEREKQKTFVAGRKIQATQEGIEEGRKK